MSTAVGGETSFSVPFPFMDNDDIVVWLFSDADDLLGSKLLEGADYTLSGAGQPTGGTVYLKVVATAGQRYLRIGQAVIDRVTSVIRAGRFSSAALDGDLDRWVIIAQELWREISHAWRAPLGSQPGLIVPGASGTTPVFDDKGNLVAGPTAEDIENAQEYAAEARQWAELAGGIAVPDGSIGTGKLANEAVTADKLPSASGLIDAINNKLLIDPERREWLHRAALLDPGAYTYFNGNFDVTVPAGETWLVVNAWWCNFGTSTGLWFHRNLKVSEAFELPAGTRVKNAHVSGGSFLWVCRPALVMDNAAYANPKKLYFERLQALRAIPVSQHTITVPSGSARGTVVDLALPTDFEDAMLLQVSTNDTTWTVLALTDGGGGSNTLDEISDDHQMRLSGKMLVPLNRKLMPTVRARGASVSGNTTDTSLANAYSVLLYQKLPSNFRTAPKALYSDSVMSDSPRIYYRFDEGTGTVIDNIGTTGAPGDAAVITPAGLGAPGAIGDNGTGISLSDDNNGRLEIPGGIGLDFGASDFTIETWVRFATAPNAAAADPWIVNAWQNPTATPNSFLLALFSQKLRFYWKNAGGTTYTVDSGITIQAGTYYHVICGRAGGNIFIRVVGKETRKTTAVTGSMSTLALNKVLIGAGYVASITYLFDGFLDEFAIYAAALSDARADAHHALSLGW